jgi:hypothetical protein
MLADQLDYVVGVDPHRDTRDHRPSVHIKTDPATFAHNRRLP